MFFFFKQKTAYEMRISDWSSDVCSSDLKDVELFHEHDEGFRVGVGLTSSEKWITIATGDHVTSEIWLLPADNPLAEPRLVSARQPGREYDVDEQDRKSTPLNFSH